MAKLTNVRERVHQPFRDSLIRTSGFYKSNVHDVTELFTVAGGNEGISNQPNGSTLPSDQSMVVLALRVFLWFRNSMERAIPDPGFPPPGSKQNNGDFTFPYPNVSAAAALQVPETILGFDRDVYRLYWQASEQILWSFGAGQKFSITSMPSAYFPYGGGLHGVAYNFGVDARVADGPSFIHWNNGMPDNQGILRLARAVLIPPRQNVLCRAQIEKLPDGGNLGLFAGFQGSRNMMSFRDNANVCDLINKVVSFTFDGLFSRDVQ